MADAAILVLALAAAAPPAAVAVGPAPCVRALPDLDGAARASVTSRCGSSGRALHDGDVVALHPRGFVRLAATLDDGRALAVTCVASGDVSVDVGGADAPWLTPTNATTCSAWDHNERVCRAADDGAEVLVCSAEARRVDKPTASADARPLGLPAWYVGDAPPPKPTPPPPTTTTTTPPAPVADDHANRIALAPFDASGVDEALASAVTDVLGVELDKFRGVDVVTPVEVRAALSREAVNQLMGCEEPTCFGMAQKLIPAGRLIGGRVSVIDGRTMVSAVLIDLARGEVRARVAQPISGDFDDVAAAMKTFALVLLDQDPVLRGSAVVVKGEVTAELLERVRVGQREKNLGVTALAGTTLLTSVSTGDAYPRSSAGFTARAVADYPVAGWFIAQGVGGVSFSNGRFVSNQDFFVQDDAGALTAAAAGTFAGDAHLVDGFAGVGLKVRPPVGVVLPYATLELTGDYLSLDVDDFTFALDPASPTEAPKLLTEPLKHKASQSLGGSVRVGAGVDYLATTNLVLSVDVTAFGTFHGLEIISVFQNEVQTFPFPPLYGFNVTLGAGFLF